MQAPHQESSLSAGFGRVCITPVEPMPLAGFGNDAERFHQCVLDDIYATCVALTDDTGSCALLITLDLCWVEDRMGAALRQAICRDTGVAEDRIYLCATHTHSAPSLHDHIGPCVQRYVSFLTEKACLCAREALADRKPCTMFTGNAAARNMNYFRHYQVRDLQTGEISYYGDQFGTLEGKEILSHVGQADDTLHLVRFARDGEKDILLVNWRAHPLFTCGLDRFELSASYIGAFVQELESLTGAHAAFFQGACGNVNSTTRIKKEWLASNMHPECQARALAEASRLPSVAEKDRDLVGRRLTKMYTYAKNLTLYAVDALCNAKPAESGRIHALQVRFPASVNHDMDHLQTQAQEVLDHWHRTYDRDANGALGARWGIRSPYHAMNILHCCEQGQSNLLTLNAVAIGNDLAFVTFPGELFDTISAGLENQSPFKTTMLFGYSHHHVGYMPSAVTYVYTSYETDTTRFAAGAAEDVMAEYVRMLGSLKENTSCNEK